MTADQIRARGKPHLRRMANGRWLCLGPMRRRRVTSVERGYGATPKAAMDDLRSVIEHLQRP